MPESKPLHPAADAAALAVIDALARTADAAVADAVRALGALRIAFAEQAKFAAADLTEAICTLLGSYRPRAESVTGATEIGQILADAAKYC